MNVYDVFVIHDWGLTYIDLTRLGLRRLMMNVDDVLVRHAGEFGRF